MDRRIIWTATAWRDFEGVAEYIARDSSHYAASFAREVREAVRSLSRFGELGRHVPELTQPDIRELFVRSYRLIYSVSEENVYILGLIHGARDLNALWERERRGY